MKTDLINSVNRIALFFGILIMVLSCTQEADQDQVKTEDLTCEYLVNPLGIDIEKPRLSWKIIANEPNLKQKAYRILVASDATKLENNIGDLWDSGKVISDRSVQISYGGAELISRQKAYWKVRIWDQNDRASVWSGVSSWEMALLKTSDWEANWIGSQTDQNTKVRENNPAIYFRKKITLDDSVKNTRTYISGLGYYELYINGKKVGDHVLAPNQTNYDRRQVNSYEKGRVANMSTRVLYETHDIESYLQKGENIIAVILANGWYFQNERSEYLPLYYDDPRFIAQIEIEKSDGSMLKINSDESWKNGKGPIIANNIYHGEIYDARLEAKDWNLNGFDDGQWEYSRIVRSPEGKLRSQMSPPDRVLGTIDPVSVSITDQGNYRYDFGTMFSGWVKLKIRGKKGTKLKFTFIEDNGNTYEQTDSYILKGEGIEEWEPKFTWHSFRFVEVSGSSSVLSIDNLIGQVVHTDVKAAGRFESSNALFNRILSDYNKTQLDNMHGGVPTDCPHRERRGYTGDGQISAQAAIYSFDMASFYTKWINDMADAQNKVTGYIPNTVPYHNGGGGTPWGSAYIIIPWYMYLYYGDINILQEHYEGMKHYLDYLRTQTDMDGLIVENELGEWVPPTVTEIPPSFVSSAYYFYNLTLLGKIADVLDKNGEADSFMEISKKTKDSFNKRYYDPNESSYSIGRQGANVFPLAFDLVPKKYENQVFKTLVKNIEISNKGHFDTGMMATPYLLEVLNKYGRQDLAYSLMNRRDFPSFGYNIERGATTLWETWTGNESHSHPMFGSVCAWFYQGLGGIQPDPKNPGFKQFIIKPNIVDELDYVNTTYPSVYGDIQSNWKFKNDDLELDIKIPPNSSASVFIPGDGKENIVTDDKNISFINEENGFIHYRVPSGEFKFISKNIKKRLRSPMLSIPVIKPADSTLFSPDSLLVSIKQYSKDAEIRYTLDGSEPDDRSKLFEQPFALAKSAVIKAKVFREGSEPGFTKSNTIVFIDSLKNGLHYKYYIGNWTKLPDFSLLNPLSKGRVYNFDLTINEELGDKFAILYTGVIDIKFKGLYTFSLSSNDGSKLWINGKLVVDADGTHGFSGKSGTILLEQGKHKIRLEYFQAGGGKGLELLYIGPNTVKQKIPADVLFLNE